MSSGKNRMNLAYSLGSQIAEKMSQTNPRDIGEMLHWTKVVSGDPDIVRDLAENCIGRAELFKLDLGWLESINSKPEDYIEDYFEKYGAPLIWWWFTLGETPPHLTADDIVKRMRIRDMVALSSSGDLISFADEFVKEGGDINVLAQRILDRAGYDRTEDSYLDILIYLCELGATNIDVGMVSDVCDRSTEDYRLTKFIDPLSLFCKKFKSERGNGNSENTVGEVLKRFMDEEDAREQYVRDLLRSWNYDDIDERLAH